MSLRIDSDRSRVIVETRAKGMLASLAHDLRVLAPLQGETLDEERCAATFDVASMRVEQSCRHGTGHWEPPSRSDRTQIEEKIHSEVFRGVRTITVDATLSGTRASLSIRAGAGQQELTVPVQVERSEASVRVRGEATLSLEALKAAQPKVPLGAIKLEDHVHVRFEVVLRSS
jgi:hypothetical protein